MVGASDRTVIRGPAALVRIAEPDTKDMVWTTAQRVRSKDLQDWRDEKRSGVGRDQRVTFISTAIDADSVFGCAHVAMKYAMQALPPRRSLLGGTSGSLVQQTFGNGTFKGPPIVAEFVHCVLPSGLEAPAFRQHWKTSSGVTPTSGLATQYGILIEVLWLSMCHDLLNPFELSSMELVARRLLMLERVVKRDCRNSDFEGLEPYLGHAMDPTGGAQPSPFAKHIAQIQKTDAIIMKQNRLVVEEVASNPKKKKENLKAKAKGKEE